MTTNYNPAQGFNYSGGAFGSTVAPIAMPQPFQDLESRIPGLQGLNNKASGVIGSELSGQLNPDTIQAIRDASAGQSVSSGMPGATPGTLGGNRTLRDFGLTSMQQQRNGIQDYNSFAPVVSGTQTVRPETQIELNTQNAVNAAAPNPAQAQSYAEGLFNKYLDQLNGGSDKKKENSRSFTPISAAGSIVPPKPQYYYKEFA